MGTENGVSAMVIDRHGSSSARVQPRVDDDMQVYTTQIETGRHFTAENRSPGASSTVHGSFDDPLPPNDFLKNIHREKCRAERSNAALSLVLYRLDDTRTQDAHHADRLLEILHSAKRETDILGHVGDDMIAVLCPDTNAQGIHGFMCKIDTQAGDLPHQAIAATYPDNLFENLAQPPCTQPAFQLFLVSEAGNQRGNGYPLKRCLDIAGALFAICLFGPLMLMAFAAVALSSPGPVIFKQTRLGRGGVPFTFYKFRSMQTNVDDAVHREYVENLIKAAPIGGDAPDGTRLPYKLQTDARITRIGRFMRKTSIDELPQLFNVLKGDMSLVGPRPPIPYETTHYQSWHLRRMLSIKPGITGLWQVEGRSRVSFNEMVRMDLRYIRDCSLAMDLKIILKTILVVLRCEGAV